MILFGVAKVKRFAGFYLTLIVTIIVSGYVDFLLSRDNFPLILTYLVYLEPISMISTIIISLPVTIIVTIDLFEVAKVKCYAGFLTNKKK